MPTALAPRQTSTLPATQTPEAPPAARSLSSVVAAASDAVAGLSLEDPRWDAIGPHLTSFVDAARRAAGGPGSPIRSDDAVAAVLRLRDLARLAQMMRLGGPNATTETETAVRSLQVAARR